MKEGKEDEAVIFFHKSAIAHSRNQNQKGRSFLALADYYFKKPDFVKSAVYYDSTIFFLDQNFPDVRTIQDRAQNLSALVSQLYIIQREDSLQKVAKMPEAQRKALISNLIAETSKDETQKKSQG